MACASPDLGSAATAVRAWRWASSSCPCCRCCPARTSASMALMRLSSCVSRTSYSGATWVYLPRSSLGLTKVSREQPLAATTSSASSTRPLRGGIRLSLRGEPLVEFGLAAGAVHDLPLELAAGRVDVVAARAAHWRDHAGGVEQLLEAPDRLVVRPLEARAGERVERDQVDLGRVLHLHAAVEVAQQLHQ